MQLPPRITTHLVQIEQAVRNVTMGQIAIEEFEALVDRLEKMFRQQLAEVEAVLREDPPLALAGHQLKPVYPKGKDAYKSMVDLQDADDAATQVHDASALRDASEPQLISSGQQARGNQPAQGVQSKASAPMRAAFGSNVPRLVGAPKILAVKAQRSRPYSLNTSSTSANSALSRPVLKIARPRGGAGTQGNASTDGHQKSVKRPWRP